MLIAKSPETQVSGLGKKVFETVVLCAGFGLQRGVLVSTPGFASASTRLNFILPMTTCAKSLPWVVDFPGKFSRRECRLWQSL